MVQSYRVYAPLGGLGGEVQSYRIYAPLGGLGVRFKGE
jgi:hypothetical protein